MSRQWRKERKAWFGGMARKIYREITRPVVHFGDPGAPDPGRWDEMLAHWNLTLDDEPNEILRHRNLLLLFGGVQLFALVAMVAYVVSDGRSVWVLSSFLLATAVCVEAMLLNFWRLNMHQKRAFCPFWLWLLAGLQIPSVPSPSPQPRSRARVVLAHDCEVLQ